MTAIDFLHRGSAFSGQTLRSASIGGTESSVVQLAEALARRGHNVMVFNSIEAPRFEYNVHWRPLSEASTQARGEVGIAVANPNVFNCLRFQSHVFWSHNPLKSWRQIRRGNIGPLLMKRPHFVLLGEYHAKHVPRWFPSSGRSIIYHGIGDDFIRSVPAPVAPPPHAIFTSQPYRGLDWLLDLWGLIKRSVPAATFDIFAPKAHQAAANEERGQLRGGIPGVSFRGNISRPNLVREFERARIQLIPGHRDETYCLAAAEAIASGVPVVTMGIGALPERVRHGKTGFIARDEAEFVAHSVALLSDDALWHTMHRACLSDATLSTWDKRAEEWEQLFLRIHK